MMRVRLIHATNVVLLASTLFGSAKLCSFFFPLVSVLNDNNDKRYTATATAAPLRRDGESLEASRLRKQKKMIHVMYGIAGDADETLHEFEVSLKSLLLSSPTDSDLNIHILTDQAAYSALDDIFKRSKISSWSLRNQVTIETYVSAQMILVVVQVVIFSSFSTTSKSLVVYIRTCNPESKSLQTLSFQRLERT